MTPAPIRRPPRGLDRRGRLELAGLGLWYAVAFVLATAQLVAAIRDERTPSGFSWRLAAVAGVVTFVVVQIVVSREWRTHGGRPLQRLGRRAWRSGRLPQHLPARVAVLRDLERRERVLATARLPVWVGAVIWALPIGLNLTTRPDPLHTLTWLVLWTVLLVPGTIDVIDRRSRKRLTDLIGELRANPLPVVRTAR